MLERFNFAEKSLLELDLTMSEKKMEYGLSFVGFKSWPLRMKEHKNLSASRILLRTIGKLMEETIIRDMITRI